MIDPWIWGYPMDPFTILAPFGLVFRPIPYIPRLRTSPASPMCAVLAFAPAVLWESLRRGITK